jgi:hypothetical protein
MSHLHTNNNPVSNSMQQNPFGNIIVPQLVKKFPALYGTQRLITVFTCPYPETEESYPCHHITFLNAPLSKYTPNYT